MLPPAAPDLTAEGAEGGVLVAAGLLPSAAARGPAGAAGTVAATSKAAATAAQALAGPSQASEISSERRAATCATAPASAEIPVPSSQAAAAASGMLATSSDSAAAASHPRAAGSERPATAPPARIGLVTRACLLWASLLILLLLAAPAHAGPEEPAGSLPKLEVYYYNPAIPGAAGELTGMAELVAYSREVGCCDARVASRETLPQLRALAEDALRRPLPVLQQPDRQHGIFRQKSFDFQLYP